MEARAAFDKILAGGAMAVAGETAATEPTPVHHPQESDVVRQNREALKAWAGLGVPVPVV